MFDAVSVKNDIVQWIRDFFDKNGKGCNAVIGISGGKDSSVVAALCAEALGRDRVIGVIMPNHHQSDIGDAHYLCEHLNIKHTVFNIGGAVNEITNGLSSSLVINHSSQEAWAITVSEQASINLPPRIRMSVLYAISQSLNGRVANTCNLSEDWIGYSTRYGDSVGDFSPLSNLTTDEVCQIGIACGLPAELVFKTPTDGLCGKTDEDSFGFSYAVLNKYIRTGICEDVDVKARIDTLHEKNRFKLQLMPVFPYGD